MSDNTEEADHILILTGRIRALEDVANLIAEGANLSDVTAWLHVEGARIRAETNRLMTLHVRPQGRA